MSLARKEIFEFGEFRLDVSEHTIERLDGVKNGTLTEKAFQALVLLVRRRGHLVSKDELINFIWPDTIVEDNNLEKCVHHLRHFLGETSEGTGYIETVRKHGYRFVGNVRAIEVSGSWIPESFRFADQQNGSAAHKADQVIKLEEIIEPRVGSGILDQETTAEAESEQIVETGSEPAEKSRHLLRRAHVLPAILLALIGGLVGLGYYFLNRSAAVLDGTRSIDAMPVEPTEPTNRSDIYDSRGTDNDDAYRNYQQAMTLLDQQRPGSTQKAVEYLDRAVRLDPNFAKGWAGKAYASSVMWNLSRSSDAEQLYQVAMMAAKRAIAIDANLSEAYTSLCDSRFAYEFDFDAAEADCKRAIDLNRNSPLAHMTYSTLLGSRGRFNESLAEARTAIELDPASLRNQRVFANGLYIARRYEEAIEVYRRLVDLNPDARMTYLWFIRALERSGHEPEAFEYLIRLLTLEKKDNETIEQFRAAYASSGWKGVVFERINTELQEENPNNGHLAEYYGQVGYKDKAFEHLEKNFHRRGFLMMYLGVDPRFDSLRDDPRLEDLIKRVERR